MGRKRSATRVLVFVVLLTLDVAAPDAQERVRIDGRVQWVAGTRMQVMTGGGSVAVDLRRVDQAARPARPPAAAPGPGGRSSWPLVPRARPQARSGAGQAARLSVPPAHQRGGSPTPAAIAVGPVLIVTPYTIARGVTNRLARRRSR